MKKIINKFPPKYRWTIHNFIAHPLMEVAYLLGKVELSQRIHDSTIPDQQNIDGIFNPERND